MTEACLTIGVHRKSAIRALSRILNEVVAPVPRPGRPSFYSETCGFILRKLHRDSDFHGSGKLRAMIPTLLKKLNHRLPDELKKEICSMPSVSIDRYLKKYRVLQNKFKRCHTRPGSKTFKRMIPLKNISNVVTKTGFMEANTVGHCGAYASGEFAFSLTMTDNLSGFTLNRAVKNKCAVQMKPALEFIRQALPFTHVSINIDNGSEYLNHLIYGYFINFAKEQGTPHPMTRSRSYQKNDNARVEQKNWTHVRQLFGYDRIDDEPFITLTNVID